ncbi:MAG: glycoside hydrolase family 55 protein [Planctomycetes bacterium]|nr:glycoside hydrolase family 55 protein [Planctomycetota bacterium]
MNALHRTCTIVLLLLTAHIALAAGDRQPGYNYVFPDDVFLHNGGRVIDVTQPPFNANPEPSRPGQEHDDTAALVAAYDFVVDRVRTHGYDNAGSQWIIYLPRGVYDVSDTITYSVEPPRFYKRYGMIYLRMWGQSRERTVIRLKDNSPGFEAGANKVVLSYHKHKGTNSETVNSLENMTIDTGSGNPGAIGVQYVAANEGRVRNLEIRSGDGQGSVGLHFPLFSVQGTFHDITVDGFDYGIRAVHEHEVNPCIEHLTLRNQREAGIDVTDGTVFIRNLDSENTCPAVRLDGRVGQVVLIDSRLAGGVADQPAIEMAGSGAMFVRNVHVDGYASAIRRDNEPILRSTHITEWVSHPVRTLFPDQQQRSLNLPIRDAPRIPWFDPTSEWVSPDAFGAKADGVTDDSAAVQAAFEAGQPCVYFPGKDYLLDQPIRVPAHVQRVEFLFSWIRRGRFLIDAASDQPILFQNSGNLAGKPKNGAAIQFVSRQPRTVVVNLATGNYRNEVKSPTPVDVFLENMVLYAGDRLCPRLTRLWGRALDTEHKGSAAMYDCRGGTLWLAGTKTEQSGTPYGVSDGGQLEALGGYTNATEASENYMVEVDNGSASVVTCQTFGGKWPNIVREKRGSDEKAASSEQFPKRPGWNGVYIPLYVGYGLIAR